MELYKCGSNVIINHCLIMAAISKIEIQFNNILYQVAYYMEGKRIEIWVHEDEFEIVNKDNKQTIGFKK